ncbi:magnesium-transporting ATPase, P-type 1-like isoform X2 [Telopea speciosissima]|uniref:magnesium-transporting ATPase, P-type 1-like isoform X2 n=1 Tax=Telopea speciosissima TaxID=54955 RepID=UPI001CC604EB|nr:magnesium-transporting ATPase, P-type 1-like isoform X2 [Telopea speciosissima]
MGLRDIPAFFGLNSHHYPATSNPVRENLVNRNGPNTIHKNGFNFSVFTFLGRLMSRKKPDGSTRTEEEDKVYNWLYALARTEKSLAFEYVQATERGLSFKEADRRLKESGPNVPLDYTFPRWWQLLWNAFFHPFNIILIVLSVLSFISSDYPNGCIMLILVFISVSLRFFQGTSVVSGSGTALVVSTGSKTYISTIFSTIGKQKPPDAFERGVRQISYALVGVMLVIVTIIVLSSYYASHDLSQSMLFGISVASALTPQMLPLIVNTNLAKGALAMARDRCIVKSLAAIQNMGVMDILCMDKTGTLTMDRAIMVHHFDSWSLPKEKVLRFAFLNSYFKTELKNPVDDAILAYVYTSGYRFDPSKWRKIDEITFDFIRRRVSVIIETDLNTNNGNNRITDRFMITKGALEEVVKVCCFVEHIDRGVTLPLSLEDYERIIQLGEQLSNDGLRVLGVATKKIKGEHNGVDTTNDEKVESNMVFLGLITFFDPPKESAKQALWRLAEKGVKAKVLTGDSLSLAIKVCKEVGIRTSHVITGPDLELLDHATFHETVKRVTVLARLTPSQKLRVVQSLQTSGNHIVGFLGDGINDSLALDAANVGISVDSGASVAKDIADIILLEKDLNVLAAGVERGRFTYGNTIKYIKMSVIANIGSVLSLLIATLFLPFEPLTPRQLLTQNFMYSVGQIAIPWDKMEEDYVKIPQKWSLKGLLWFLLWNAPVCSICDISTLAFLCFYYGTYSPLETNFFHSAWFTEGLLMQTLIIHLVRTEKIPFIQEVASWPLICSTVVISGIGIAIPFTPIGKVMGLGKLPLSYFGFLVVLFLGYFSVGQMVKRIYILIYKQWL